MTSKKAYIAIILALVGVIIMTFSNYTLGGWNLFGDFLAIIDMLAVAGYIIRGREMKKKYSTVIYSFMVYGFFNIISGISLKGIYSIFCFSSNTTYLWSHFL